MCAGVYLDGAYRDAVIDELYIHEERVAAPSFGHDAARVLAHALRARHRELGWATTLAVLWAVGVLAGGPLMVVVAISGLGLSLARWVRGTGSPGLGRILLALYLRWPAMVGLVLVLPSLVFSIFGGGSSTTTTSYGYTTVTSEHHWWDLSTSATQSWITLVVCTAVAVVVALRRGQFARIMADELHRDRFAMLENDPAEHSEGRRYQHLRALIRAEQHAPLVMYEPTRPFCGAGVPYPTWTLAAELRPDPDRDGEPKPISNRLMLERVRQLLEGLRVPAPSAGGAVRDRLRQLKIDEVVFMPVDGMPDRPTATGTLRHFPFFQEAAVEEGGEVRRHFLRARVGGWEEEVVTTVFIRIHTQGGMVMLEIAPHVLPPVRPEFGNADRIAHQYRRYKPIGKMVWALAHTPQSLGWALSTLARGMAATWRLLTGGYGEALPEGPGASVRELASVQRGSLFQEMDVERYLKAVQDRVTHGVRQILTEAGYRTDEFVQKVVHVSEGGMFIDRPTGAFAIGNDNTVTNKGHFGGGRHDSRTT
jgi:hypothetical protein